MKRVKAVIRKEFAHILRDPTSLTIIFLLPLLMIFIYGYSINFDLETVETGIVDFSGGDHGKKLVERFSNNKYYEVTDLRAISPDPVAQGERMLKSGELKAMVIIPEDFSRKLENGQKTEVGIILDGSDSNVANLVYQYNEMILLNFAQDYQPLSNVVDIKTKILFNPELKSVFFFIPGLVAILLVMISAILTSISIAREKESGSIDLIFISPLKTWEIIVGKTVPYISVALLVECMILLCARFWFEIPFRGSLLVLFAFSLLYIIAGLSMGILISTVAPSQKTAMFMALVSTLLPSIMLSGFIFPLESMGIVLRGISHIVPATYFLRIIRGVVVKGADLHHFLWEGAALLGFAMLLLAIAGKKFSMQRKRMK